MDDAYSYLESGNVAPADGASKIVTGAGNNPSTWAGLIVIGALVALTCTRKSFRRFM